MSGGSYDYAYIKVEEMAGAFLKSDDPRRVAFGKHLCKVAKAMHDVEWVDSYDYGKGEEHAAIEAALGASASTAVAEAVLEQAEKAAERVEAAIEALRAELGRATP